MHESSNFKLSSALARLSSDDNSLARLRSLRFLPLKRFLTCFSPIKEPQSLQELVVAVQNFLGVRGEVEDAI